MNFFFYIIILRLVGFALGSIHPIEISGSHFYNSVTGEPFFIKGVDYQPDGSSGFTGESDPLSNPQTCARDIIMFQELGINTIRIYSINPELNHSKCMTMLAMAGIYLLLDVNSPLQNQHINRYEPWTTYNTIYLEHVFTLVQEFSQYNNTLGFFAGNEIINDHKSSENSPVYVKQVVTDIKNYIESNCVRDIPVGYSAADDLRYRVSLSKYLECESPGDSQMKSVDFYGVNSYQWCGQQTLQTSGYDELIKAYTNFTKPVFFSEYGCNRVLPRQFQESEVLYSPVMAEVFSGGLVYEFTQEANNYGLVKIDPHGNAQILKDFNTLKTRFMAIEDSLKQQSFKEDLNAAPLCQPQYTNLDINMGTPTKLAKTLIEKGVSPITDGYCDLDSKDTETKYKIYDSDGSLWDISKGIRLINGLTDDAVQNDPKSKGKGEDKTIRKNSAIMRSIPIKSLICWITVTILIPLYLFR